MRIGELARQTHSAVETIRFYERSGLLSSAGRSTANYRDYGPAQVERLNFIRRCRTLDMSLDEIRALLDFCDRPSTNCAAVNDLLDEHIQHVESRLKELRRLSRELRDIRDACRVPGVADECQILRRLKQAPQQTVRRSRGSHASSSHGRGSAR